MPRPFQQAYHSLCYRHKDDTFPCPLCHDQNRVVSLKEYRTDHVRTVHNILPKKKCPYCLLDMLTLDYQHLHDCLTTFLFNRRQDNLSDDESSSSDSSTDDSDAGAMWNVDSICPCATTHEEQWLSLQHPRIPEYGSFYDPVFEQANWWVQASVPFDNESNIGREMSSVLDQYALFDFYHLIVQGRGFNEFVNTMNPVHHVFALLPYYCLCDGLEATSHHRDFACPSHIHHRHMIAAVKSKHIFLSKWRSIRVRDVQRVAISKRIESPIHLINAVYYVSRKTSSRNRILGQQRIDHVPDLQQSHYFRSRPMGEHARLHMSVLVKNGLADYLNRKNRHKYFFDWMEHIVERDHKFYVPVYRTGVPVLDCVLPLRRDCVYDDPQGTGRIYLLDDTVVPIHRLPAESDLSRLTWLRRSMSENGNRFLNCVHTTLFQLSGKQTYAYKHCLYDRERIETNLRRSWEIRERTLMAQTKRDMNQLKGRTTELEEQMELLKIEMDALKIDQRRLKVQWKTETSRSKKQFEAERKRWKTDSRQKISELKKQFEKTKEKWQRSMDRQTKPLKTELEKLRAENIYLKSISA